MYRHIAKIVKKDKMVVMKCVVKRFMCIWTVLVLKLILIQNV